MIEESRRMYTEEELVRVAGRENNSQRKYLVVNTLQGKHVPAAPKESLCMFGALADKLEKAYGTEELLLIGFAETATAIGAALAVRLNSYYMQTTREDVEGAEYLFFTESHSHAREQRVVKTDLGQVMDKVQRVVFVEDELTTGNTILKIVDLIRKNYPGKVRFAAVSLLNGMNREALGRYSSEGIGLQYLVKTDHSAYTATAGQYKGDGLYFGPDFTIPAVEAEKIWADGWLDARRLLKGRDYQDACEKLWNQIRGSLEDKKGQKILILGTEEFMYPAIFIGSRLEKCTVKTHSTTRSPIAVSMEKEYPLHSRFELASFYEKVRVTFIYNLESYDHVLILTDSRKDIPEAEYCLIHALTRCGSRKITLVRWNKG